MDRVAVAILNWNGISHLRNFLPTVVEYSPNADVWVIDNGSTDESLSWIRETLPSVKIIELTENHGFAGGYNEGLKQIDAEYYVLLNSDVEVTRDWIDPVISMMKDEGFAACQPKILDHNNQDRFEHAGAAGGFIDKDGYTFCAGRIFFEFEKDKGQYDDNREVFWASGAALFIKSELYHSVGGLDKQFFAHMEEIDLCWRLKNRGHRIGCCGKSKVYHVGGGTLNAINPFKTYLNFRNNLFLITKNQFTSLLFFRLMKRLVLDGIAGVRFVLEGKFSYCLAVLRAHFSFYVQLRSMLKKRKKEKKELSFPNLAGSYHRSILYDFFFMKIRHFSELPPAEFVHQ